MSIKRYYHSELSKGSTLGGDGSAMVVLKSNLELPLFIFVVIVTTGIVSSSSSLSGLSSSGCAFHRRYGSSAACNRRFWISDDMFWKDGNPFRIIGGDVHYFRILPQYWRDRLLRAKALGLNTIQTYVPWNLHEPEPKRWVFEGIADIESYLKLAQELGFLVMLRPGPYICAEWDFGGFPAWLLAIEPPLKLRSSDKTFLAYVQRWWDVLLPKIAPLLYENGGPIIMVQIENEFGSYGYDKKYLHYLVALARKYLGNETILYTTDGGSRDTLDNGTIPEKGVFSAVDFSTGEDPWPIFQLQKEYNAPGKSPPLSAEFYTGWLTHWGEKIAETDANYTAAALEKILSRNGSVVLYMAHGGTNFGFYSGANTGQNESDYKADLTSYDYDAPIKESGDVGNPKYEALRRVIQKYSGVVLPRAPPDNKKLGYGLVDLRKIASFNEVLNDIYDSTMVVKSEHPMSMETVGQMFGFMLYASKLPPRKRSSILKILKVHDRAQVFVSCGLDKAGGHPIYIGVIERWSNRELLIPKISCSSNSSLLILVENLGRLNYGQYISDKKGILSNVFIDGTALHGWQMFPIPLDRFSNFTTVNPIKQISDLMTENISTGPGIYEGHVTINSAKQIKDTFISFRGWNKGIAFVNDFNIGRFWPSLGPQCTLYVPAPLLREGENIVVILELHAPNPDFTINLVKKPDFTCGTKSRRNDNYRE
ncbi:beta-galactosidase 8-like isoform X1 [Zingiber officinale]|uniref:beta-galactosidase 8-like isoform X1 n=1 Tax=Zingiber officinale TaxID=94328 RepID=UPI001C4B28EF|nr:beta-galactosidase 8-like isoform X1 [Zingiber officinale]